MNKCNPVDHHSGLRCFQFDIGRLPLESNIEHLLGREVEGDSPAHLSEFHIRGVGLRAPALTLHDNPVSPWRKERRQRAGDIGDVKGHGAAP
jgi:hypothetical protein